MTIQVDTPSYDSYKGRYIDPSKKVRLYRNLNNGKISIKQGTLVVGHADSVTIKNACFIVYENNRQRVLEKRQKNVHAFIEGYWDNELELTTDSESLETVWYNPYQTKYFRVLSNNESIHLADIVTVTSDGKIICKR